MTIVLVLTKLIKNADILKMPALFQSMVRSALLHQLLLRSQSLGIIELVTLKFRHNLLQA